MKVTFKRNSVNTLTELQADFELAKQTLLDGSYKKGKIEWRLTRLSLVIMELLLLVQNDAEVKHSRSASKQKKSKKESLCALP